MDTWQTIVLAIAGNGVVVATLVYAGKAVFERILARDSDRFRMDLQHAADTAIEQLKSELQRRTTEHQVRFSALHERRALAIAEIFGLLSEALWAVESYLSPLELTGEPSKSEKYLEATNKLAALYRYFDKHRIYLPSDLCAALEGFIRKVRQHAVDFRRSSRQGDLTQPGGEQLDSWVRNWEAITTEVPAARRALEDAFRALLEGSANQTLHTTVRAN